MHAARPPSHWVHEALALRSSAPCAALSVHTAPNVCAPRPSTPGKHLRVLEAEGACLKLRGGGVNCGNSDGGGKSERLHNGWSAGGRNASGRAPLRFIVMPYPQPSQTGRQLVAPMGQGAEWL